MSPRTEDSTERPELDLGEVVARCGRFRLSGRHGLLLVVVISAALRFYGLGTRSFHGDEILTVEMGSSPQMWALQKQARPAWHPPLHYAIPKLSYLAGAETEFEWRIVGAVFGVLTAVAAFLIPAVWGASRLSLPVGLLVAISPMGVLFSQSNRWHPLVGGILAFGCVGLIAAVRRRALWGWVVALVCFVLACYTVFMAGAVVFVLMLLALWGVRRSAIQWKQWLVAALVCTLGVAPIVGSALAWSFPKIGAPAGMDGASIAGALAKVAVLVQNLTVGPTVLPWNWAVMIPATVLLVWLGWRFLVSSDADVASIRPVTVAFFFLCLLVTLVAPAISSSRYWLVLLVPVSIALGGGLVSISSRKWRAVGALGLAALAAYGLGNLYTGRQYQYLELVDDWRGLAELTRQMARPGDEVWTVMGPFQYYYGPESICVREWRDDREKARARIEATGAKRVFVQYSPMSGWHGINFTSRGKDAGAELGKLGFEMQWQEHYHRDPDVGMKRKLLRGREFSEYRHVLELWEREGGAG